MSHRDENINTELEADHLADYYNRKIKNIVISCTEYLGDRKDDEFFQISISCNLYHCLKKIIKYQNDKSESQKNYTGMQASKSGCSLYNIVTKHTLSLNYGYDDPDGLCSAFCNATPNYVFEISLHRHHLENLSLIKYILDSPLMPDEFNIPGYYRKLYKSKPSATDSKKIGILTTNTKTKRLGYFKLLADLLEKYKNIPKSIIHKKFESFVAPFEDELNQYKNPKGAIRISKTGISAKPYIELARKSGLINYLNGVYTAGKLFKVYIQLKNEFSNENAFNLSLFDKIFFGEHIFRQDFFYMTNLAELIYICEPTDYAEIKLYFQPYTLKKLEEIKGQGYGLYKLSHQETGKIRAKYNELKRNIPEGFDITEYQLSRKELNEMNVIYKRIGEWKKPYLEHVLMPRLNWLFDLDLIELDKKLTIRLTDCGRIFFQHICFWNDMIFDRVVSPDYFLDNFSAHLFSAVYQNDQNFTLTQDRDDIKQKITEYINESFECFKTLAPNRVTASQAISYAKYKLYFKDNINAEYSDILQFFENDRQKKFLIKMQKRQHDGYIQKIR